ncbi:MAG: hypothetical protein HZA16_10595 [Nitrospirae bacterium]|nr:hypothetical protein [Nitrospirota bacterium]
MMKSSFRIMWTLILGILLAGYLTACGGGGGGGGSSKDDDNGGGTGSVGTTYNAAASIGDLLTYTVNTETLEYTYSFIEGTYAGATGNGTLSKASGYGDYVYTTSDGVPVVLLPNNLVIAALSNIDLIVGVPKLTTGYSTSEIAGIYNYVEYTNYGGSYGTFQASAGGVWQSWDQTDAIGLPDSSGTWTDQGNGVIYVYNSSLMKIANAMLLPSAGGGKVIVIDFTGTKKGIGIGVKQQSITSGSVNGKYDILDSSESQMYTVTVNGTDVTTPLGSLTVIYDFPWTGFVYAPSLGGLYLMTPDGIFFGGDGYSVLAGIKE